MNTKTNMLIVSIESREILIVTAGVTIRYEDVNPLAPELFFF